MKINLSFFKKIHVHPTLTQVWLGALAGTVVGVIAVASVAAVIFSKVSKADVATDATATTTAVMVSHERVNSALDVLMRRAEAFERLRTMSSALPDVTR